MLILVLITAFTKFCGININESIHKHHNFKLQGDDINCNCYCTCAIS